MKSEPKLNNGFEEGLDMRPNLLGFGSMKILKNSFAPVVVEDRGSVSLDR